MSCFRISVLTQKLVLAAVALPSVVLASHSAMGQSTELGSVISKARPAVIEQEGEVSGDAARKIVDGYAACIVKRKYMATMKALQTTARSAERQAALAGLAGSDCLGNGRLRFSSTSMQASIYKALVARDFGRKPAEFGPTPIDFAEMTRTFGVRPADLVLNLAGCLIRKDEPDVRAIILASAGSPAERAGIERITPHMSICLPADQTLRFSPSFLAGALAEAYYREAKANIPAGAN